MPGFTLVATRDAKSKRRFIPAIRGGHLIVGRHTEADVCLDGDRTVWLRHLLIRAVRLDDGNHLNAAAWDPGHR